MIKVNLLKSGLAVYDDSEPGGIIDIQKLETNHIIKPCLYEVLWDKEEFNKYMRKRKK